MAKVFKYQLPISDAVKVYMPKDAKVLCVQVQNGQPCIWASVNPDKELEERQFRIAGTGHTIEDGIVDNYIGTVQLHDGKLVFHVFEVRYEKDDVQ